MMRKFGAFMAQMRRMANDFRASFDDMARQSELDELRREVEAMREKASDPLGMSSTFNEMESEIRSNLSDSPAPDYEPYVPNMEVDNSVPWDGAMAGLNPPPEPAAEVVAERPKRSRKPKVDAAAMDVSPSVPKPRVRKTKMIVEGSSEPQIDVVASPRRRSAKKASDA